MKISNFDPEYSAILAGGGATAVYSMSSNSYYAVASNATFSFGSNANDVGSSGAGGASESVSRADHVHRGVTAIAHSSNSYSGNVTLVAGANIGIVSAASGQYTIIGSGGSGLPPASGSYPPLDYEYTIDGTYGDHFTGSSLSGSWTRRNYTSGAETYQVGLNATYLRIKPDGRTYGDGYYRTAPAGDFTIAMKVIPRGFTTSAPNLGPAILDSSGNGVSVVTYTAPFSPILVKVTTWSTYGSSYVQPGGSGDNLNYLYYDVESRPIWFYIRKSSDNYYFAYSFDGEAWSVESNAINYSFTVAYIAMLNGPLGTVSYSALSRYDVDWFTTVTL